MPVGIGLQDRADGGVDLGVHQHDVLAVPERLEGHTRAELDRAGHIDQHVDIAGERASSMASSVATGLPLADRDVELALRVGATTSSEPAYAHSVDCPLDAAVEDAPPGACPAMVLHDLVGQPAAP